MTKAAEIVAALIERKPGLVFERRTGMTHGWGLWMRELPIRLGAITSDAADAITGVLLGRPVAPAPRRPVALTPWQAFRSLFYQDWGPPLPEERGLRWLAGVTSLLMHLLFGLLLLFMALVRVPPSPEAESDGSRVQIEFLGAATPEEQGGGASEAGAPAAVPQAATTAPSDAAPETSSLPREDQVEPARPAAQQTLQVTETEAPTSDFVLPPTTPRTPDFVPPRITAPELGVPTREVRIVQVPPAQRLEPRRDVPVPTVAAPEITVREREIPAPLPAVRTLAIPAPAVPVPAVRSPVPTIRQAEIAAPAAASASSRSSPSQARAAGSSPAEAPTAPRQSRSDTGGGSGPLTGTRPGGAPSAQRGDDWGASTREVPGSATNGTDKPGLFNDDGSVRLPSEGTAGKAPQAGPPGSRQAQQADTDRASKWLERPEYPYDPTMFDKFWVPNESLLAEWVRRNINEVDIPIPGTSKKVRCVVSILQLGGACGLSDPNLNDQPSSARPPPDIPVKRTPIPVDS